MIKSVYLHKTVLHQSHSTVEIVVIVSTSCKVAWRSRFCYNRWLKSRNLAWGWVNNNTFYRALKERYHKLRNFLVQQNTGFMHKVSIPTINVHSATGWLLNTILINLEKSFSKVGNGFNDRLRLERNCTQKLFTPLENIPLE